VAIIAIVLIETAVVHLLVRQWSPRVAWMLTVLSGLGLIEIIRYYRRKSRRA
jgi:hypothetical protein